VAIRRRIAIGGRQAQVGVDVDLRTPRLIFDDSSTGAAVGFFDVAAALVDDSASLAEPEEEPQASPGGCSMRLWISMRSMASASPVGGLVNSCRAVAGADGGWPGVDLSAF